MLNSIYTKKFCSSKIILKNTNSEVIQEIQAKIPEKWKFRSPQEDPKPHPILQNKKIQRSKDPKLQSDLTKKKKNPEKDPSRKSSLQRKEINPGESKPNGRPCK